MSKPRVRCASTKRPPGVVRKNQRRGSPEHFCIPTTPLTRAVRARTWVAKEVSGYRIPNHAYGVRPRRDHPGVARANRPRGRFQYFCIPTTPLSLDIRARTFVAVELSARGSPNHKCGVRPRRHHRVMWVQTEGEFPMNICASQPRRLHAPFVRVLGWPKKYLAIEIQTTRTVCVHDATTRV